MRQGKHAELTLRQGERLRQLAHALSSQVRLDMLEKLGKHSMNVGELAAALNLPMSTAALNVRVLEEAGLIITETQPGSRGAMKLCSRRLDSIAISLAPVEDKPAATLVLHMPVGGYSVAEGIRPTCGLADENSYIGLPDMPQSFYDPARFGAQLLWMRQGWVEYRFAVPGMETFLPEWLEISFEACSEAPMYRDPWKSDIFVEVNGVRLGTWCSPCDCGGRRGTLTPAWWSSMSTQFGFLKTWRVDAGGAYLDKVRLSDVQMDALHLTRGSYISVRIGVDANAQNVGGLNLFGEKFGDFRQGLLLNLGYRLRTTEGAH